MIHRAVVTAADTRGVYVRVAALGPTAIGPIGWLGDKPVVGERVFVGDAGDGATPDMVVLGQAGPVARWKGGSVVPWNYGEYADLDEILEFIADLGTNVVTIPVAVAADGLTDSEPAVDAGRLAWAQTIAAALPAHVKIIAEPYPWIADGTLSETLWNPSNVATWFTNWTAACVEVAEAFPQAVMVYVGSNLALLDADHDEDWLGVLSAVRAVTNAEVSYRCNWWFEDARLDALCGWDFLKSVDVVSVAAYFELTNTPSPDYDEVRTSLDASLIRGQSIVGDVARLHAATGRPVFFGELVCSRFEYATTTPWAPNPTIPGSDPPVVSTAVDPMVQARMYRAYVDAFGGYDWWRGFSVYGLAGFDDSGYILERSAKTYLKSVRSG